MTANRRVFWRAFAEMTFQKDKNQKKDKPKRILNCEFGKNSNLERRNSKLKKQTKYCTDNYCSLFFDILILILFICKQKTK